MIVGLTADRFQSIPLSLTMKIFKWIGVPFCELTTTILDYPKVPIKYRKRMLLGYHLPNIGDFGYDFSSITQQDKIDAVIDYLKTYKKKIPFQYVLFHPPQELPFPNMMDRYIENLKQVPYPLILENIQTYDLANFQRFYHKVKEKLGDRLAGICLDVPHAHLSKSDWKVFFKTFQDEVVTIHLSNCSETEDLHHPFSYKGALHLYEILNTLQSYEYKGIVNFEIKPESLARLDLYFDTIIRTIEFFSPGRTKRMRRRTRFLTRIGKVLDRLTPLRNA